jgi:glycopeptide antibiotics resistance protein
MLTKNLLVAKNIFFWIAAGWTLVIAVLCLVSFNSFRDVDIKMKDADKFVHATFHFMFTILWYLHFRRSTPGMNTVKLFAVILSLSILYGISIEIAQELFTTTRQADVKDVLANLTGGILGVLTLALTRKLTQKGQYN